jgi:hypothetical protein
MRRMMWALQRIAVCQQHVSFFHLSSTTVLQAVRFHQT